MRRDSDPDKLKQKSQDSDDRSSRSNHGAVAPEHVPEGWLWLGQVGRPHGIRGAFFLKTEDNRQEWPGYDSVLLVSRNLEKICNVEKAFNSGGKLAVQLDVLNSREMTELHYNAYLYVAREKLKLAADEFLVVDLVGCQVSIEGRDGIFGRVVAVHNFGAQETLEIQPSEKLRDTVLYPFTDHFVLSVDEKKKLLTLKDEPAFLEEEKE